jgi:D-alanyl-D-alanine carboxypeptidase
MLDYGFILRYLEGKENITWFEYEPWHLRYIWDAFVAREIAKNWWTLEEYLNQKNN